MEQLVARWAHNPKAVGSSPAPATQKALAFMPGLFLCPIFDLMILSFYLVQQTGYEIRKYLPIWKMISFSNQDIIY